MSASASVIYYSSTGTIHKLAEAVAAGAQDAGAEVRLRRVEKTAPDTAIDSQPEWREHLHQTRGVPVATHDDLLWADAVLFGTPTRFGNVAAQLKQFLDTTGPLWSEGRLADKAVGGFVAAATPHGGHESTLLALYTTIYHWGSVVVTPGYTDPVIFETTGNPYGTSHVAGEDERMDKTLMAGRLRGRRTARFARTLRSLSAETGASTAG